MESIVSYSVVYNFRRRFNNDGTAPVHIRLYSKSGKVRRYIDTGVRVKPELWDDDLKLVKKRHENHTFLNNKIADRFEYYRALEMRCLADGIVFDWAVIDKGTNSSNKTKSFIKFAEELINSNNRIGKQTRENELISVRHFKEFAGDVLFRDIDYALIVEYDNYLRRAESRIKSDFSVYDKHKTLRKYIKQAILLKYIPADAYPYASFKMKMPESEKHGLRMDELVQVENVNIFGKKRLEFSKDLFLFSCYTGLRWGDVTDLKRHKVFIDMDKQENSTINISTGKTGTKVVLPIGTLFGGKAMDIIQKYSTNDRLNVFPPAENSVVNAHLKQISFGANLDYSLNFHMARHTFGSILADLYPDPYLIKSLMGHKDIKTSMNYIKTSNKAVADKLKKIKWS